MGYAIGKAPAADGTGTEPEDVQQWLWSLYRSDKPSIARGGVVSGTSGMAYSVAPAVLVVPAGDSRRLVVPTDRVTVPTAAAPSSGSRTDIIYAGSDGAIKVGTTLPDNNVMIDKRRVPAGITATTATTSLLGDRIWAPLVGGTMGRLMTWEESLASGTQMPAGEKSVMSKTITVEEDRLVDFRHFMTASVGVFTDPELGRVDWGTVEWSIYIDGDLQWTWAYKVENTQTTQSFSANRGLTAGTHTIELRRWVWAENRPIYWVGGAKRWAGTNLTALDLGALA